MKQRLNRGITKEEQENLIQLFKDATLIEVIVVLCRMTSLRRTVTVTEVTGSKRQTAFLCLKLFVSSWLIPLVAQDDNA
jgi:hypothetical protein